MGSKVSQPVRILALVGLLGALALGAGFALLGKSSGSTSEPKAIKPLHGHLKAGAATKTATPVVHAKAKAHAKPAVTAAHKARVAAQPKPKPVAVVQLPDNGLPAAVNQALASHE